MGLIFKDTGPKEEKKPKKTAETVQSQPQSLSNTILPGMSAEGKPDDRFIKMLQEVIAANNIPGQDYFEFKQSIEAMSSMSLDEKNKFLAVYIAGQYKKDILLSSIDKYDSILQGEQKGFMKDLAIQYDERVTRKHATIEQAKKDLEALNKKIMETNNLILTTTQEAQQEELNLKMTESSFIRSIEKVLATLNDDRQKITNFIQ